MSHQDWEPVVLKKKTAAKPKSTEAAVADAKRTGGSVGLATKQKAATNKQSGGPVVDARKLEDEDNDAHLPTVSADLKVQIQQARSAKGWKQAELAQKINEKVTVVADYEAGRGIPDPKVLAKMSKALGVKLKK